MGQEIQPSQQLIEQVNELMRQGFELTDDQLVPTATLIGDLGLDSLDAVDMLVFIEDKLGVKVDGERLRSLRTLQDVYALAADAIANPKGDVAKDVSKDAAT